MMMARHKLNYRKATIEDKVQLKALGLLSYGQYQSVLEPEYFEQLHANLQNDEKLEELISRSTCFVCQDQELIVGMAYLVPQGNPWDIFKSEWSYIRMVGVNPDYQGLGIAKELTKRCIVHAKETGEQTIALHTSEFMHAARHIYESLGFKIVQEIPERLGKRYWLYTLDLVNRKKKHTRNMITDHIQRIELAKRSLTGVSIGDAFGDRFFGDADMIAESLEERKIPSGKWEFTDDTVMSIAIFDELEIAGEIDQDRLIRRFCVNHDLDPNRGYGATLRKLLREVGEGQSWQTVSKNVFEGQGSMGNGAAMRVCPIGAFYFDDLQKVKTLAIRSAEVTHANPEAMAGAMSVAIATALASRIKQEGTYPAPLDFIDAILHELPPSDTTSKIAKAKSIPYTYHIETVRKILGNGVNMTAQDTVPFVIWCAAHNLENFEEALWKAVSVLGDRDTICAMVAGITIMSCHDASVPKDWLSSVESFEKSDFRRSL